ncbi:MAG TPA: amino acid ABC transporter permease [Propionibacteriaceae bacterium]|nr:amino acid ABC transporter permease [Propionibacteriaceae bacterium]
MTGTTSASRSSVGRHSPVDKALSGLVVAAVVIGFIWWSFRRAGVEVNIETVWEYRSRWVDGFIGTVVISLGALVLSLALGALTAAASRSSILVIRYFARFYVQLIRSTPLLVQIYVFFYVIGTAWGLDNRYVMGILILSVFEGAYIAEIIRGGWQSIEAQTYEIARAIALTPTQTFRLVTLPILLSRTVPALAGQFASIIKDSSLLSVIAVIELTQTTQEISAENFQMFANYLLLAALYFVLTFSVSLVSTWLERRLGRAFADQQPA